jgi:hypothetical protein
MPSMRDEEDPWSNDNACAACADATVNPVHATLLRILGTLTFVFGVIELGLGGTVYNFLSNVKLGAWWCAIGVVICGFIGSVPKSKRWVAITCVFSSMSCVLTALGAYYDGSNSITYQNLTACSSTDKTTYETIDKGNKADYTAARACMFEKVESQFDVCYCVTGGGGFCGEYAISKHALTLGLNCGDLLHTYANALTASAAFCALSFIMVVTMSILSCVVICCPSCGGGDHLRKSAPEVDNRSRENNAVVFRQRQ